MRGRRAALRFEKCLGQKHPDRSLQYLGKHSHGTDSTPAQLPVVARRSPAGVHVAQLQTGRAHHDPLARLARLAMLTAADGEPVADRDRCPPHGSAAAGLR